jgi:predicted secreted protein
MGKGTTMKKKSPGLGKARRIFSGLLRRRLNFGDERSRRVVLVPHCALNQNSRVAGAAVQPAAMEHLIAGLMRRNIGIIQIPCPELMLLGLDRAHMSIRTELEKVESRTKLRSLCSDLVEQILTYQSCGVEVLAIFGKNGSPTCGVEKTWHRCVVPGTGVFIEEMHGMLKAHGLKVKILGIEDQEPEAVLSKLEAM